MAIVPKKKTFLLWPEQWNFEIFNKKTEEFYLFSHKKPTSKYMLILIPITVIQKWPQKI